MVTGLKNLLFFSSRNVLTSASNLMSLVVKNVCSDAMLKLIGTHCHNLQFLDISNSFKVSDVGVESLCCQVQIRDRDKESPGFLTTTLLLNLPYRWTAPDCESKCYPSFCFIRVWFKRFFSGDYCMTCISIHIDRCQNCAIFSRMSKCLKKVRILDWIQQIADCWRLGTGPATALLPEVWLRRTLLSPLHHPLDWSTAVGRPQEH